MTTPLYETDRKEYYTRLTAWAENLGLDPDTIAGGPVEILRSIGGAFYKYETYVNINGAPAPDIDAKEAIYDTRHKFIEWEQAHEAIRLGLVPDVHNLLA